jgi:hypothetical protein
MDHDPAAVDDLIQADELADDDINIPMKKEDEAGDHTPVQKDKSTAYGYLTPPTTPDKIHSAHLLRIGRISTPSSDGRKDGIESTEDRDENGEEFTRLLLMPKPVYVQYLG